MAQKARAVQPRWTFHCPENVTKPKGPYRCLDDAIKLLGPIRYKTSREAEAKGAWGTLDDHRLPLSREVAEELITDIAITFNVDTYLAANAPRLKSLLTQLTELECRARDLARFIEQLDDITLMHVRPEGMPEALRSSLKNLLPIADLHGLPSAQERSERQDDWTNGLYALADVARRVREHTLRMRGFDGNTPADKGGSTNLFKEHNGSPGWALVYAALQVYELFKPGEATGTEGGNFHQFTMTVFEFATGDDPDDCSHFLPWVKKLAKLARQIREKNTELGAIAEQFDKFDKGEAHLTSNMAAELAARECQLWDQQHQLRCAMWPHLKLSRQ